MKFIFMVTWYNKIQCTKIGVISGQFVYLYLKTPLVIYIFSSITILCLEEVNYMYTIVFLPVQQPHMALVTSSTTSP